MIMTLPLILMNCLMKLKSEFRRRLEFLYRCLGSTLASDAEGDVLIGNLLPALFQVFSFLWSPDYKNLLKK